MFYVLAFLFLVFGAMLTYAGYSQVLSNRRKLETWLRVDGTVIELVGLDRLDPVGKTYAEGSRRMARRRRGVVAPKYRYTVDGVERTVISGTASWPPEHEVGDTVGLVVNPENTSEADAIGGRAAAGYAFLAMGLVITALGLLFGWLVLTERAP